jgi:hypothetical protein
MAAGSVTVRVGRPLSVLGTAAVTDGLSQTTAPVRIVDALRSAAFIASQCVPLEVSRMCVSNTSGSCRNSSPDSGVGERQEAEAVPELVQQHRHEVELVAVLIVQAVVPRAALEATGRADVRVEPRDDVTGAVGARSRPAILFARATTYHVRASGAFVKPCTLVAGPRRPASRSWRRNRGLEGCLDADLDVAVDQRPRGRPPSGRR